MTPLHVAAERGYTEIVDYLVCKGANVNIQEKNGVIKCDCSNKSLVFADVSLS